MATFLAWVIIIGFILMMLLAMASVLVVLIRILNEGMENPHVPGTGTHSSEEPEGIRLRVVREDDPQGE